MMSYMTFVTPASRSTFMRSCWNAAMSRRLSSRIWESWAATSPGSSTRCLRDGSGSSAFRLISSSRSGRPRKNLWWENSQVCTSADVRWARGVYNEPLVLRSYDTWFGDLRG